MTKPILGPFILASAIIWGATIIGASLLMRGLEETPRVLSLLGGGAGAHLILVWGPLAAALKKAREGASREQGD